MREILLNDIAHGRSGDREIPAISVYLPENLNIMKLLKEK